MVPVWETPLRNFFPVSIPHPDHCVVMDNGSSETDKAAQLEKLRRHTRILVDIGRLASENAGPDRFLDQTMLQIARAVEIHHVKILRYRPETSDLCLSQVWMEARFGPKRQLFNRPAYASRSSLPRRLSQ